MNRDNQDKVLALEWLRTHLLIWYLHYRILRSLDAEEESEAKFLGFSREEKLPRQTRKVSWSRCVHSFILQVLNAYCVLAPILGRY